MIRLATFEKNDLLPFKEISKEQYDKLKLDCNVLKEVYTQFVVFKYLQLNIKEYSTFIERWEKVPANKMQFTIGTNIHYILQANRFVLNVLVGFKFFLDNAEAYLKRKYGKNSTSVESHIKLTREFFDKSFAYRFLSKLRNYYAHLGFPLEVVNFDIEFNQTNPEISEHSCQLLINPKALLDEKDLFGSIVTKDLEKINFKIDLIPLIAQLSSLIIKIQRNINSIQENEIDVAIENIEFFVGNKKTEKNEIKVYHDFEQEGREISFKVFHVPMEIIKELKLFNETGANTR